MIELFERHKLSDVITAFIIASITIGFIRSFAKAIAGEDTNPAGEIAETFMGNILVLLSSVIILAYLRHRHKS